MRFRRASAGDAQRKPGRGALMIEYVVIGALLAIAAVTVMTGLGVSLDPTFRNSSTNRAF